MRARHFTTSIVHLISYITLRDLFIVSVMLQTEVLLSVFSTAMKLHLCELKLSALFSLYTERLWLCCTSAYEGDV